MKGYRLTVLISCMITNSVWTMEEPPKNNRDCDSPATENQQPIFDANEQSQSIRTVYAITSVIYDGEAILEKAKYLLETLKSSASDK